MRLVIRQSYAVTSATVLVNARSSIRVVAKGATYAISCEFEGMQLFTS